MTEKLREYFDDMVVFKDLKNNSVFSSLGLPSFTRDWLLRKFEDDEGNFDIEELSAFVRRYIPQRSNWNAIKSRIVKDHERVKMLTKISIDVNIRTGEISFSLPDLGLSSKETIIEDYIWQEVKEELVSGQEVWGMLELGYRDPDDSARPRIPGKSALWLSKTSVRTRLIWNTIRISPAILRSQNGLMSFLVQLTIMRAAINPKRKAHHADSAASICGKAFEPD